ncbi:hypothetical protein WDU94_000961 [Cyamophila willieti]
MDCQTATLSKRWAIAAEEREWKYRLSIYYVKLLDSGVFTCTTPRGLSNSVQVTVKGVHCERLTLRSHELLKTKIDGHRLGQMAHFHCPPGTIREGPANITCMANEKERDKHNEKEGEGERKRKWGRREKEKQVRGGEGGEKDRKGNKGFLEVEREKGDGGRKRRRRMREREEQAQRKGRRRREKESEGGDRKDRKGGGGGGGGGVGGGRRKEDD